MSVSLTTTYAGEFSGKYIAAALLSADTLDKGLITVMPNVKFKSVIQKASTDDIVKDASCAFEPNQGTLTLTEAILQPEEFQVNMDICKKDLHDSWEAEQMGYSAFDNLAPNFADFVLAHVAAKVADRTEKNIWSGSTAVSGQFDGFETLLAADAALPAGQELTGAAVTNLNVQEFLGAVVDAIPTAVYGSEDLIIYAASDVIRAYTRALGGFTALGGGANGYENKGNNQVLGNLFFDGIPVVAARGANAGTIIAAEKSNLFFGTGLTSDFQEVRVLDLAEIDGSQNVRVVMRFTAGVQYAQVTDIVYRKTV
jgi:hypothetical protein